MGESLFDVCEQVRIKQFAQSRIFLLVDLQDFYFRFRVWGGDEEEEKSSENDQLTVHFQSFF